jgi:hypothetical protein
MKPTEKINTELLDALRECLKFAEGFSDDRPKSKFERMKERARQAIKSATEKQP